MTDSMISYRTIFEATNNLPMPIVIGHGENAALVASFTDGGVDVNLSGYTARAIYQPKSKWGTDDWYECSCEIVENTVVAHWGNTYDNGDNAVKLFMHLVKDGKLAYPAIYQIRLFETPGFSPSTIEPIPETIDFAEYNIVNAPWVPLSGNVSVTGDLTMDDKDIIHTVSRTATIKNIQYFNDTEEHYQGNVDVSFDSIYLDELVHISDIEIPIRISGTLESSGETEVTEAKLTSPAVLLIEDDERIRGQIVSGGTNIGVLDFTSDNGQVVVRSGDIFEDYLIHGDFIADTTETVDESKKYIYDDMRYATKMELRHLETLVNSILSSLSE